MIAYTKRLEFEIRRQMDTPLRMFRVLLMKHAAIQKFSQGHHTYQGIKEIFFSEEMKLEDVTKIMKFANQLIGSAATQTLSCSISLESNPMQTLNVSEFVHAL